MVPAGLTNVVAIAGGHSHSLALKSDGTVVAWGSTSSGETLVPPGLSNVTSIAAGGVESLALTPGLQFSSVALNGQTAVLRFHTFLGQQYWLQYSANLSAGSWLDLPGGAIVGNGYDAMVSDTNAVMNDPNRFYRLRQ